MAYTDKEVAVLQKAAEEGPITFERARELAAELYKTDRSVIAKVNQLGLDYVPREYAPKREKGMTKAELVAEIAENLGAEGDVFEGLEKATARALGRLVDATR